MGQPNPADPGATPPATTPPADPPKTDPPATGDGLSEAGKKALAEERAARKELEKQVKELQARDPLKAIAEALGQKPTGATGDDLAATVKQLQQQMRDAELKAARLEVAAAKGMTAEQAAELRGSTREELEAHADRLRALFPATAASATPGVPAPDPSQGARGGGPDREALIREAQAKGDWREVIRLQNEKLAGIKPA